LQFFPQVLPGKLRKSLLPVVVAAFLVSSCEAPKPSEVPIAPESCVLGSRLAGNAYGAIAATISWRASDMACSGMRRPGDEGARLRFAGTIGNGDDERRLAIILAMPQLVEAAIGDEHPTRVTLIEEDEGRFFSTRNNNLCWTDIHRQSPLIGENRRHIEKRYVISGLLYCVAPIPELNGTGSVTLGDLEFIGQLSWAKPL